MPRIHTLKVRDVVVLVFVLTAAALIRFSEAGRVEFFHDEAMLSMLAQEMADGYTFPLTGIVSSVGLPNPPTSVWVMAIPYLFSSNPLVATLFVAALNVIGVGVLWFITRRYMGATVALVAALVYALNPWAILYSRKIWAQDFMTPFMLLAVLLALYGLIEGKRWARVLALPLMLFAAQIHFAGWALLPLMLVLLWSWRERLTRLDVALTVALSALVLFPYALGLVQTLQNNPDTLSTVFDRTVAGDGLTLSGDALRFTAYFVTGLGVETWVAPQQQDALLANVPTLPLVWGLLGALMLIGAFAVWIEYRPLAPLLTLWVVVPLLVFSVTWTQAYPHYFIAVLPAYAVLIAVGAMSLIRVLPQRPIARAVILAGIAGILFTQQAWWSGMLRYVSTREIAFGAGTSGYTTPISALLNTADTVRDAARVTVYSDGQDPLFHADAARWSVLLRDSGACLSVIPRDKTFTQGANVGMALESPARVAVWVLPDGVTVTDGEVLDTVQARIKGEQYVVTAGDSIPAPDWVTVERVRFANGVTLDAYAVTQTRVYLRWQLPDARSRLLFDARRDNYQYFVHVLNESGERIAQYDEAYLQGRWWCGGDTLITWTPHTDTDTSMIRVGFYSLTPQPDSGLPYTPVDVLDKANNPFGQWIELNVR